MTRPRSNDTSAPDPPSRARLDVEARLRGHVERLAGEIGERNVFRPERLDAACDYIQEEWERQGYRVISQEFDTRGHRCANLEVERAGTTAPRRILLVGAHYDSVLGSPGANDNGSGVAALLEISRRLMGISPRVTARFVAFVNEEPPFFMTSQQGSRQYARRARARGDDIRLMVSLETIGCYREEPGSQRYPPLFGLFYPKRGNFIAFVSDFRSRKAMRHALDRFRAATDFPVESVATFRFVPGVGWSDHHSFWREGYRAIMVTDTAFYRDPFYHTPNDTPDKLSYAGFARVTEGLARAFEDLCMDERGPAP